jgi:hypothetical protein
MTAAEEESLCIIGSPDGKVIILSQEVCTMKEKHSESKQTAPDALFESREDTYQDVERMIGEGLSGGSVHEGSSSANIEQARPLVREEPPAKPLSK